MILVISLIKIFEGFSHNMYSFDKKKSTSNKIKTNCFFFQCVAAVAKSIHDDDLDQTITVHLAEQIKPDYDQDSIPSVTILTTEIANFIGNFIMSRTQDISTFESTCGPVKASEIMQNHEFESTCLCPEAKYF